MASRTIIIAYVPVLHEGYRAFFAKHKDADAVYLFGPALIAKYDHLAKEIRALAPELIQSALLEWGVSKDVKVAQEADITMLAGDASVTIIAPDEDVVRSLIEELLPRHTVHYDKVFLRWDKHKSMEEKPIDADQTISRDAFDREMMGMLAKEAEKSSDWWRRIGACIVKEGKVVLATHNTHVPSPHTPYTNGDPRNNFHKGIHVELSTSLHAEAGLIAEAARRGIALEGTSLYASVFPCPPCAKQIAYAGVKKLYYAGGYGVLDGLEVLRSKGVEIIYVDKK
jgi:dCMP deaminase